MSDRRSSIWPWWAWMMVAAVLIVLVAGAFRRLFLPALLLDLVSFWPVAALGLLVALAIWPFARRGPARLAAIGPLILLTWVGLALWLHYSEWEQLPSVEADLVQAYRGETDVDLALDFGGELRVNSTEAALYSVRLNRRGGEFGVPEALVDAGGGVIRILEVEGSDWFSSSGWILDLSQLARWDVSLRAQTLDVDLAGVLLTSVEIDGDGTVTLPPVAEEVAVSLSGMLLVRVPAGVPVRIDGDADVPGDWQIIEGVLQSPESGPGYQLTIAPGAAVTVRDR